MKRPIGFIGFALVVSAVMAGTFVGTAAAETLPPANQLVGAPPEPPVGTNVAGREDERRPMGISGAAGAVPYPEPEFERYDPPADYDSSASNDD